MGEKGKNISKMGEREGKRGKGGRMEENTGEKRGGK